MTDKEDAMKTRPGAKLAAMSGLLILTLLLLSLRSSRSQPIRLEPTPNPVLNPPDRPLRVAVIDVFYPGDGAFDSEADRQFQLLLHDAVDIDGDRRRDPYYHGDIVSIFLGSTGVDVVPHRIVDMRDPKHQILGHLRRILWRVRSGETMDAVLLAWESSALESSFGEIPTTDRERRYRDEVRSWSDGSDSWRQTSAIIEALGDLTRAGVEVYTIAGNAGRRPGASAGRGLGQGAGAARTARSAMLRMTCRCGSSGVQAGEGEGEQAGLGVVPGGGVEFGAVPLDVGQGRRRGSGSPVRKRSRRRLGWRLRSAIMPRVKRSMSAFALQARRQSNQPIGRCPGSRCCCCRRLGAQHLVAGEQHRDALAEQQDGHEVARLAPAQGQDLGSSVAPSTPQFQLRLWSQPSRLSSPLAWLCLWL
jgi:hypothetical protein